MFRADARKGADVLLAADLRGVDSHGVARLSSYVRLWENGRINAQPKIRVVHETPSTAVIDGDSGLGLVVAPAAMACAIKKAEQVGTGWVAVKNSNHYGIAGYHAMQALEHDMIGMSMTNASPLVVPTFSRERMLAPTRSPLPFLPEKSPLSSPISPRQRRPTENWRFFNARKLTSLPAGSRTPRATRVTIVMP